MSEQTKPNFDRALSKLSDFLRSPVDDEELVRTAVIQAFEYTFEAGWKVLRAEVLSAGEVPQGPRDTIRLATSLGFLSDSDEEVWLAMLMDRNNSVHTYNQELAIAMERRTRTQFAAVLSQLG